MKTVAGGTRAGGLVVCSVVFVVIAFLMVLSRLYTRIKIVRNPGVDDSCVVIALIFSVGMSATMLLQVKYGLGQHERNLTDWQRLTSLKPFYASIILYYLALSFTKISILLQYLRIFPQDKFRRSCYIMLGVVTIFALWSVLSAAIPCWPIQFFWDPSLPGGHCIDRLAVWFANAGINISTDVITLILPMPVFRSLQLPKRQKIALMVVFGLAGFVCLVSILRLQSLYVISKSSDVSWDNPPAAMWSVIEVNVGIVCSCLPTLKACVSRYLPRFLNSELSYHFSGPSHRDNPSRSVGFVKQPSKHSMSRSKQGTSFGLVSRGDAKQLSHVHTRATCSEDDILADYGHSLQPHEMYEEDQIKVVTVVQQEIEKSDENGPQRPHPTYWDARPYYHDSA